jgi:hypothetical protein
MRRTVRRAQIKRQFASLSTRKPGYSGIHGSIVNIVGSIVQTSPEQNEEEEDAPWHGCAPV